MKYIRIGNDFALLMKIKRGDQLEDLREAINMELLCNAHGQSIGVDFEVVSRDTVRVQVTPAIAGAPGLYNFEIAYAFASTSYADGDEKCRADVDAFRIVPQTSNADVVSEVHVCADVLIGLRGAAFKYENFTEAQLADIRLPGVEAGAIATSAAQLANEKAQLANDKAQLAVDATTSANNKVIEIDNMLVDWVQVEALIVAEEQRRMQREDATLLAESQRKAAELLRVANDADREVKTNKQNSLEVDGTGKKYVTVDAVNEALVELISSEVGTVEYNDINLNNYG